MTHYGRNATRYNAAMPNQRADGVVTVSFRFNQSELALLERIAKLHKTKKAAIIDALEKSERASGPEASNAQLVATLKRTILEVERRLK